MENTSTRRYTKVEQIQWQIRFLEAQKKEIEELLKLKRVELQKENLKMTKKKATNI